MSNTTTSVAIATVLSLAAVQPAAALGNNGLSNKQAKQVRTIVKQEVRKILRGPRGEKGLDGPAGPAGPIGPPGLPGVDGVDGAGTFRFAEISKGGFLVRGRGISQENIIATEFPDPNLENVDHAEYCIVGLPTPLAAQVSTTVDIGDHNPHEEQTLINTESGQVCVVTSSGIADSHESGFTLLLLY